MVDLGVLLTDLNDESADLDRLVAPLPAADWRRDTPADGWTIAHQIAHLSWTDRVTTLAATDPEAFAEQVLAPAVDDPEGYVDRGAEDSLAPPATLLARWRTGRAELAAALARTPPGTRIPWFGVQMTAPSMATARIMETWAHGEDVGQALHLARTPTNRLRHVAFLGVRTLGHSFEVHGRPAPTEPVYVELTGPDGATWAFGSPAAANRITGPALDFCLLVTQRRHPADLALTVHGPVATQWLEVAQAFAGPPGRGRTPEGTAAPGETPGGGRDARPR